MDKNFAGTDNKIFNVVMYCIIAVSILVYSYNVGHYALNLPHWDDYDAILRFLNEYKVAAPGEKVALLFAQQNEHRILLSRLVYVTYYTLAGDINFRNIILLNIGVLLGVFLIIESLIRKAVPQYWQVVVAVLSFAMFSLDNFENADFAMAGMQNYGILLLFVGSIFCYSRAGSKYLVPAVLLQVLCVFSSGNGIIGSLFITSFAVLGKDRMKAIAAIAVLVVVSPMYYIGYQRPPADFFTADPGKFIPYFLHAIAAHFGYDGGVWVGVALLVLLLALLPVGKKLAVKSNALPLLCLAGFILASMGVMAVFRGGQPVESSYTSRYFIYSHMLVALVFAFALIKLHERKKLQIPVMIAVGLLTLFAYGKSMEYGKGGLEWMYTTLKNYAYNYPVPETGKHIANEACRQGIYCIDEHRQDD